MEKDFQYTSCTVGAQTCKCFEKLNEEEINLLEKNSVFIKYNKKEFVFCE